MFERFKSKFIADAAPLTPSCYVPVGHLEEPRLRDLLLLFAGASFNRGLYRVMAADTFVLANNFIALAYSGYSGRAVPFAYDWLGRMFALDPARVEADSPAVVMFEPGTGEALEMPCNLLTFHESELVDYCEEALAANFHRQWLTKTGSAPEHNQCVGYRRLLFLGGKDTVENLELSDLDVYWTLAGQLVQKTRGLPRGTRVDNLRLND